MYIAHILSLLLYLAIPIIASVSATKASSTFTGSVRMVLVGYLTFATLLSFVFIGLQIDWIMSNNNDAVGTTTSFFWLLFDYLNAISYIFAVTAIGMASDLYKLTYKRLEECEQKPKCDAVIGKGGIVCFDGSDLVDIHNGIDEAQNGIRIYLKDITNVTENLKKTSETIEKKAEENKNYPCP